MAKKKVNLTSTAFKGFLWDVMNDIKNDQLDSKQGTAIASNARALISFIDVELKADSRRAKQALLAYKKSVA